MNTIGNIRNSLSNKLEQMQSTMKNRLESSNKAMQYLSTDPIKIDTFEKQNVTNQYKTYSPDDVNNQLDKQSRSSIDINLKAIQSDMDKMKKLFNQ